MLTSFRKVSGIELKICLQWGTTLLIFVIGIFSSSCRHSYHQSTFQSHPKHSLTPGDRNVATTPVQITSVNSLLENPKPQIGQDITIMGTIKDFKVKKGPRGSSILELTLKDRKEIQKPQISSPTISHLKLADQLNEIGENLLESARNIELTNIEPSLFKDMSYTLKIDGNRMEALSHFFRSKDLLEVGDEVQSIAKGYLKLGDAFYTFSEIVIEDEPKLMMEQIDFEPVEINSPMGPNEFQLALAAVSNNLSSIAEELINSRYKIISGHVLLENYGISNNKAYSLLSVGELLEAKSWESRKDQNQVAEQQFKVVSTGFTLLGKGMNDLYNGFKNLGNKLTIKANPIPMPTTKTSSLRCAYIGYNDHVINDCQNKVKQLGVDGLLTIEGQLVKGNLMEELNVLWVKMRSVTIDDLTIDLAYDDVPATWRNLTSFYDWVKETTN